MKGEKAYTLARSIHKLMYERSHIPEEQLRLYDQYFGYLKKAAYQGHTEAFCEMGAQFEDIGYLGIPNPMYHPQRAIYWYLKACNEGHAEAHNNLAHFYEKGEGCNIDLKKALVHYKASAELGSPNGKKNYKIMVKQMTKGGL